MKRGIYIGPWQYLRGKTALLKDVVLTGKPMVLAQFDDKNLMTELGFCWTPFFLEDFRIEEKEVQA